MKKTLRNNKSTRLSSLFFAAAFALAAFVITDAAAAKSAADNMRADTFIRTLADEATSVLGKKNGSTLAEREAKFRSVLRDNFAMDKIGRFAAGRYWRQMSRDERRDYQKLFTERMLKSYAIRFGGYSGKSLRILKTVKAGKKDSLVRTVIENTKNGKQLVRVDWRVRRVTDSNKIIDILVEGVSMLATLRAEFTSVIKRDGIEGLLSTLRTQLDQLKQVATNDAS